MPRILCVVVSFNSARVLERCIASIQRTRDGADVRIVIIDNGSTDASVSIAQNIEGCEVVAKHTNVGYGRAVNDAWQRFPEHELILIVNPDVVFLEGTIPRLVASLETAGAPAAIGPRFLNADGTDSGVPNGRAVVGPVAILLHITLGRMIGRASNRWTERYHRKVADGRGVHWLSGACLLIRADAFRELGGFDEHYFLYCEDVALGVRLRQRGYQLVYDPSLVVEHEAGTSSSYNGRYRRAWRSFIRVTHHLHSLARFYCFDYRAHRQSEAEGR